MRDPFLIIKTARITEKTTGLSEKHNQYVFKVAVSATKQEIKHAVKALFKKDVVRVNTMQVGGKLKRENSLHFGKRPDWKKAIVTLKPGEKIELV
jgi:large subunit ribosomal protein L23